jgi:hypothetical protein
VKRQHIGLSLGLATLAVQASVVMAPAADFTCQVFGGSFVLDDSDFKALGEGTITREKFASLDLTSKTRAGICATRKLWRLIKEGKADACDFFEHYKNAVPMYLGDSELAAFMKAQADAFEKEQAQRRSGNTKKCQ